MIYILLATILYAAATLAGTAASRHANTIVVSAVINSMSALVTLVIAAPLLSRAAFTSHKFGILMAVLNGVFIALFVLLLTKSLSVNKVGIVAPIVFGGSILISTVLSYFIFNEKATLLETLGLIFVLVGISIVAYARATA
jgi:drug/metabolite transporter (DMT)-like permease